jgi:rod shape-determining protein MreB
MPMRCAVVTQDRQLFEGEVDMVVAPGTEGIMGILPNHAPLLTTLAFGELIVRTGEDEEIFVVAGGVMEVQPDAVVILADSGEHVAEIDEERAENARQRAEGFQNSGYLPLESTSEKLHGYVLKGVERRSAMALLGKDLGIDLGTVNTLVSDGGEIVLHEPTMVAVDIDELKIVEVGQAAREMDGRVPDIIEVMRPMREGVIADFEVTMRMLRIFVEKVCGPARLFKPRAMITVPYGVTSVESRAVHEAGLQAGNREVHLIQEPLAAAIGVGLPIATPSGNLVVILGGGVTQAAVLAMSGIVVADSVRIGGLKMDEAISSYVRKKYGLVISQRTAEEAKIRIGAAVPQDEELTIEIQGQDQVTGLPRPITMSTNEVVEALQETLVLELAAVKNVLERTPPELASDIIDRGMVVCGGGSLLRGIDKWLTRETGVPAYLAEEPVDSISIGANRGLSMLERLRRNLPTV